MLDGWGTIVELQTEESYSANSSSISISDAPSDVDMMKRLAYTKLKTFLHVTVEIIVDKG